MLGKRRMTGQEEAQCVTFARFVRCCSRWRCYPCLPFRPRKFCCRSTSAHLPFPFTSSLLFLAKVSSGSPATGLGARSDTTGYPARGRWLPNPACYGRPATGASRSEEHTSELQSRSDLVCRLLLEKKKKQIDYHFDNALLLAQELQCSH